MKKKWYEEALLVNRDPDWVFTCLNDSTKEEMIE